jgi:hypothetical protein
MVPRRVVLTRLEMLPAVTSLRASRFRAELVPGGAKRENIKRNRARDKPLPLTSQLGSVPCASLPSSLPWQHFLYPPRSRLKHLRSDPAASV